MASAMLRHNQLNLKALTVKAFGSICSFDPKSICEGNNGRDLDKSVYTNVGRLRC